VAEEEKGLGAKKRRAPGTQKLVETEKKKVTKKQKNGLGLGKAPNAKGKGGEADHIRGASESKKGPVLGQRKKK